MRAEIVSFDHHIKGLKKNSVPKRVPNCKLILLSEGLTKRNDNLVKIHFVSKRKGGEFKDDQGLVMEPDLCHYSIKNYKTFFLQNFSNPKFTMMTFKIVQFSFYEFLG